MLAMKTNLSRLAYGALCLLVASTAAFSQQPLARRKGPTSKIYLSETKGETQIQTAEKLYRARQAMAFDAPGTVIETKENSHNAFVFSNGTGMYVDENSRVDITRFTQERFVPNRETAADALVEPSISQSEVYVSRGFVGICTSHLVSGSSMTYSTPQATLNIRGGKVAIQSNAEETIVDLLEGDLTVRSGVKDVGGRVLQPGERAIIRPATNSQPAQFTIGPIPAELMTSLDSRVSIACNARKTVSFETIDKAGLDEPATFANPDGETEEIQPRPTVPANPPANIVVSPDRLPGG